MNRRQHATLNTILFACGCTWWLSALLAPWPWCLVGGVAALLAWWAAWL